MTTTSLFAWTVLQRRLCLAWVPSVLRSSRNQRTLVRVAASNSNNHNEERPASFGRVALPSVAQPLRSNLLRHASVTTSDAVDSVVTDSTTDSTTDDWEDLPTNDNDEQLLRIRHSAAHVMAMAVQQVYPEAQVTIGPWIETGFYYDFYFPPTVDPITGEPLEGRKLTDADLKVIQKTMDKIISKNYPMTREEVSREEARRRIAQLNEPFKLELLDSIQTEPITIYHVGDVWWDLCAGPHVASTNEIPKKALQLTSVAGAYWRGDEHRERLQRIYGTVWKHPAQLKQYQHLLAEAKKRDHRTLGQQLDLFSIQEEAGGGLVFWHPKGSKIRRLIEDFWKDAHVASGYDVVYSPHIANINLWKTSGHFDFYKQDMFDQMQVEEEQYQIKPMNCPFHCLMYKDELRSYRDLPFRWAELGTVYRYV
jgi:threonyl-tRNA synthetase